MANLAITRQCLRGCAYCFAADERARCAVADMEPSVFEGALDFLERSGVTDARLLGGEPLLHPAFHALAARALERGFSLTVITGGCAPEQVLADFVAFVEQVDGGCAANGGPADGGRLKVFLNAALPDRDEPALVRAQGRLLEAIGSRVELGVTLTTGQEWGWATPPLTPAASSGADALLALIARYGARPRLRVGVAHPIWRGENRYVPSEGLRMLGRDIETIVTRAEMTGVSVGFDCGLVPCMFSADFATSHAALMAQTGMRCGPVVDVLPEGYVIACFALSHGPRMTLDAAATREGYAREFERWQRRQPHARMLAECADCPHRARGLCGGGCRARRLARGGAAGAPRKESGPR